MSYNYTQYVTQLANMLVIDQNNANYQTALNNIIDSAEQRIYRELDPLNNVIRDQTGTLTANSRTFNLPQTYGRFVGTESMSVFTPAGTTMNRNQMVPSTREFIDYTWGSDTAPSTPSIPTYYAPITDEQFIVGPPPDANYAMEVIGWIRPTPLSASNPTTYLTLYLPDLFLAESLIFGYGYLKDFGAATDDPNGSVTWSAHYKDLWQSANTEEQRKRYASQAWTPKQPAAIATPPRV